MRDEFPQRVKDTLAKRARGKCSNPECRIETSGAHSDPDKALNIGEAAHITAASPGGPRYDPTLTPKQRRSIENAIWLCGSCSTLIDSDVLKYTVEVLQKWKHLAEQGDEHEIAKMAMFSKLEGMMQALLAEMRKDLTETPLARVIVIKPERAIFNGNALAYYFETHDHLADKMTILCNYGLIEAIPSVNAQRYRLKEDLVNYLTHAN